MLKTVSSITNAIGALNYVGTWNASTNTPALASSVGNKGDYYQVSVAGSTTLNGISNWGVGDVAAFNGSTWQRIEGGADLNGVNLSVSGNADMGNVRVTGNTVSTTNTNGNLNLTPNGSGIVEQAQPSAKSRMNSTTHPGYLGKGATQELNTQNNQFGNGAQVYARAYGNVNEARVGVSFAVMDGSSATPVDAFHITNAKELLPAVDGTQNIGSNNFYVGPGFVNLRYNTIYATNGTINTSDIKEKENIAPSGLGLNFVLALQPVSYTWKNFDPLVTVETDADGNIVRTETPKEKGRTHYGLIAQQAAEAAVQCGVNLGEFAPFILSDPKDPTSSAGLRYHEFISPMIKAIQELHAEIESLKSEIATLKGA